jgi:S-formylglutathione hydrolase
MKVLKKHKSFDGEVQFVEHASDFTKTNMKFSYFKPQGKIHGAIIFLSGLTCTEENFITKAGAQKFLAEQGLMVICPDTSPRGLQLPNEHEAYDFGSGAGFYLDALVDGYKDHYRMYSYVNEELYTLVNSQFHLNHQISLSGHSMGGHGALVIGLRNPEKYRSLSAFAPIVNPTGCAWGEKAFRGYLGSDKTAWDQYDTCQLLEAGQVHSQTILVDQGLGDEFLEKQLLTPHLEKAAQQANQSLEVHYREGYDHSYYFIATFIEQHVLFHKKHLGN